MFIEFHCLFILDCTHSSLRLELRVRSIKFMYFRRNDFHLLVYFFSRTKLVPCFSKGSIRNFALTSWQTFDPKEEKRRRSDRSMPHDSCCLLREAPCWPQALPIPGSCIAEGVFTIERVPVVVFSRPDYNHKMDNILIFFPKR